LTSSELYVLIDIEITLGELIGLRVSTINKVGRPFKPVWVIPAKGSGD